MDFSKFKCKYLKPDSIQEVIDELIDKYHINTGVAVDIEMLIDDVGLKLDIVSLEYQYDAYLKLNNLEIAVNTTRYYDERLYNRLRFSLAHELGHFILHEQYMKSFALDNIEEYFNFKQNIPELEYKKFEWQANEFAGRLLVNTKVLRQKYDEYMNETWNTDKVNLIFHLANFFQVSEEVMTIRLMILLEIR